MRVLIVCSGNSGRIAPFIKEQTDSLTIKGSVECEFFLIKKKGVFGYLQHLPSLIKKIKQFNPDLIHAHYGYSGLLANLQRRVPVVTTYPGSDINETKSRIFSTLSILLSRYNIFMTKNQKDKVHKVTRNNSTVIPYGILIDTLFPVDKNTARDKLALNRNDKLVLFSSKFSREGKNVELALASVELLDNVKLLELTGTYSREEMCYLFNAVDVCLMTSIAEGSPQFIKEAMACNCPIVSVNVGDVKELTENVEGCYICNTYQKQEIADNLLKALQLTKRTNGRDKILNIGYDTESIARKLVQIYNQLLHV